MRCKCGGILQHTLTDVDGRRYYGCGGRVLTKLTKAVMFSCKGVLHNENGEEVKGKITFKTGGKTRREICK